MRIRSFYSLVVVGFIAACVSPIAATPTNQVPVAKAASATPIRTPTRTSSIEKTEARVNTTKEPANTTSPTRQLTVNRTSTKAAVASASATLTSYAYLATVTYTPAPVYTGIVADHTVLSQFSSIPQSAAQTAATQKTIFLHQSTGSYIDNYGLGCLAGLHDDPENYPQECTTYANARASSGWPWYNNTNWNWDFWPEYTTDALIKTDEFVSYVNAHASSYDVFGMKFCYVDGWNQGENVDQQYYINKMLSLESQYPNKVFIWTTSALWHEPGDACSLNPNQNYNSCQRISEYNAQIRTYAKAHNKLLYDIADIESHDSNGNSCTVEGYEGMCAEWYDNSGGHPNVVGAIRLAKGFWWLMARVNGWNGQ